MQPRPREALIPGDRQEAYKLKYKASNHAKKKHAQIRNNSEEKVTQYAF